MIKTILTVKKRLNRKLAIEGILLTMVDFRTNYARDVLQCMRGTTTKVKNIKKYLLASLFNAPSTMNGYYQAEVNHDMPGLVR